MATTRRISARATTAADVSRSVATLLPEVEQESVARLRALVIVLGALQLGGLILNAIGPSLWGWDAATSRVGMAMTSALLAISVAFLWLIERGKSAPRTLLDLGLGYEALYAFGIGLGEQAQLEPHGGLSMVVVLILLFPLFVPSSPRRTLFASLAAATMALLAHLAHWSFGPPNQTLPEGYWVEHGLNFLFAVLAIVPAKVVARLSRDVSRARRMGSYELTEKLGKGGMGEVWRAQHCMLRRPAAIKLLRPEALGAQDPDAAVRLVKRFEREAQVTATLESPHSVELYDFGVTDDGIFYHVIELLEGIDLDRLVRDHGPLPPERVVHILLQVCESLDDAHRKGMIHRDVKPANIYLTRRGRQYDFVKVLDFGLVKVCEPSDRGSVLASVDGEVQGTPAFLPPEAVKGHVELDARADIYALGCVAYWLLTGSLLFEAKTPIQMAVSHATRDPLPPSARSPGPIPEALEEIVMACLAKSPNDRPRTALVLAQKLERCRDEMEDHWNETRAAVWWRTHLPEGATTAPTGQPRHRSPLLASDEGGEDDDDAEPAAKDETEAGATASFREPLKSAYRGP